jgi:hypothetical protein
MKVPAFALPDYRTVVRLVVSELPGLAKVCFLDLLVEARSFTEGDQFWSEREVS